MNAISTLKSNASSGLYSPTQQNKQISENENSLEKAVPSEKIYATAQNYNVHSMSLDATISMSQELYDSGNISLMDHAILSFDPGRISGGSTMLTTPDQNGNYDLISEFKARMEMDKKLGNTQNLQNNKHLFEILVKLDALHSGPVDIRV